MSTSIMHHFEDKELKYLACRHDDVGSFSVEVSQAGGMGIWFSPPTSVTGHEVSYRWLIDMLDGMKNRLTEEYLLWRGKEKSNDKD